MQNLLSGLGMTAAGLVLLGLGLAGLGRSRWTRLTDQLLARLKAAETVPARARFDPRALDALPAPVQRYLRAVLPADGRCIAGVHMTHHGQFNLSAEGAPNWQPFRSTQQVVLQRPGFVWSAAIALRPGLPVRVHDAYLAGEGWLHAALGGVFKLARLSGRGSLAQGELLRFLAEAPWYPTALLPSATLQWLPVDADRARLRCVDGPLVAELLVHFGADGLIDTVRAEARGRSVAGQMRPTPWEGRWHDYVLRDGVRVPSRGEVAWLLPEGPLPYWRGQLDSLDLRYAG